MDPKTIRARDGRRIKIEPTADGHTNITIKRALGSEGETIALNREEALEVLQALTVITRGRNSGYRTATLFKEGK